MSNYTIERQLEIVINLLENMPSRICDEIEKREEIKKAIRMKELTLEMNCLREQNAQINKMKYGADPKNYTMDCNNDGLQPVEDSLEEKKGWIYSGPPIQDPRSPK